jgi:hypothetical protein
MGQEVGSGKEPTTMEDVEDVKDRKVNTPRKGPRGSPPHRSGSSGPLEERGRAELEETPCQGAGERMDSGENMVVRDQEASGKP